MKLLASTLLISALLCAPALAGGKMEVVNRSTVVASRGQTFDLDAGAAKLNVSVN